MKKLTIIALALITLGATSQIVEKNIDKEEVKLLLLRISKSTMKKTAILTLVMITTLKIH